MAPAAFAGGAPVAAAPAKPLDSKLGGGPLLHFEVTHPFSRTDARTRVQQLLEYWKGRFGVQNSWAGDHAFVSGRVMGIDFRARIDVNERAVDADTSDPGALLRGSARDYIGRKLKKYLSPTYQES